MISAGLHAVKVVKEPPSLAKSELPPNRAMLQSTPKNPTAPSAKFQHVDSKMLEYAGRPAALRAAAQVPQHKPFEEPDPYFVTEIVKRKGGRMTFIATRFSREGKDLSHQKVMIQLKRERGKWMLVYRSMTVKGGKTIYGPKKYVRVDLEGKGRVSSRVTNMAAINAALTYNGGIKHLRQARQTLKTKLIALKKAIPSDSTRRIKIPAKDSSQGSFSDSHDFSLTRGKNTIRISGDYWGGGNKIRVSVEIRRSKRRGTLYRLSSNYLSKLSKRSSARQRALAAKRRRSRRGRKPPSERVAGGRRK